MNRNLGTAVVSIGGDNTELEAAMREAQSILSAGLSKIASLAAAVGNNLKDDFSIAAVDVEKVASAMASVVTNSLPSIAALDGIKVNGMAAFETISDSVGRYGIAVGLATGTMEVLGQIASNNIGLIITHTVKLINRFVDLYNNSLNVRFGIEAIKFAFVAIWETAKLVFKNISEGFSTIGKVAGAIFRGEISTIGDIVKNGFNNIVENVVGYGTKMGEGLAAGAAAAMTNSLSYVKEEDFTAFIESFTKVGQSAGQKVVEGVKAKVDTIAEVVQETTRKLDLSGIFFNTNALLAGGKVFTKFYDELNEKMRVAVENQKLFGSEFDLTGAKVKILEDGIKSLIENGLSASSSVIVELNQKLIGLRENISNVTVDLRGIMSDALDSFGDKIGESIAKATSIGDALKGSFFGIFDVLAGVMATLGKTAIKAGIGIEAINKAFQFSGGFGAIAAGVALIAFSKVIKSGVASAAPRLAKGGLAYGETLAVVGDNKNASVDPEVIAPLSKLKSMLNDVGGSVGRLTAEISGDKLLMVLDRARYSSGVITGR